MFASVCVLGGCAQVPPANLARDRFEYGEAVAESWKRQTLMNVVRLRYANTPAFLDVQSVVTPDSQTANWTGTASLEGPKPNRSGSLGLEGSQSWTSAPTISFQPTTGDEFTKRLLAPMSPVTILMLIQAGWPIELVMPTLVRSVNGLHAAFRNAKADPEFVEMIQLLAEHQRAQLAMHRELLLGDQTILQDSVRVRSGKEPPRDAYALVLYKGNWFWIDDTDLPSKRLFTFLMILLSISETGKPMAAPVLTISTGAR